MEDSTPQNSVIGSDHSKSSEVALIGSLFPEIKSLDVGSRDRKYSRKYNVTEDHIEEERNSFKWIPEQSQYPSELSVRPEKKISHKHLDATMSTLDSDKTSSSCTASDFTNNVYTKNGYIRGTNDKKFGPEPSPTLKYNEFSSLISSLGTSKNFPVEVKLEENEANKESEKRPCIDEEHNIYLILGGIQMMLGILMAVFGVLVIAHGSSLSGAGSGLWGGALAMFSGLMGILAGLKGCYANHKRIKASRTLLTIFLALCLVSFAFSNLVVVLTATGLFRDVQKPKNEVDEESSQDHRMNWPPVLSDGGLIIASVLQCVAAVYSSYKCYKKVCPCLGNNQTRPSNDVFQNDKYKVEGKERLVNHWLGQQFHMNSKKNKCEGQDSLMPWATPNIVLLPPPPPMISNGQIPIWTFFQPPSSVLGPSVCGHSLYSGSVPCCCHHDNRYVAKPATIVHEKRASRRTNYIQPDIKVPVKKSRSRKRERRASLPTAEEVARTYTGLDREIAEEFIAIAMDRGGRSRHNSFAEFAIE